MNLDSEGKWRVNGYLHPRTYAWVIEKKWDAGKAPWWLIKRYFLACTAWERKPTTYVSSVTYDLITLKGVRLASGPNARNEYYGANKNGD